VQKRPITNILKSRPKRTVYRELESAPGQEAHVVKRFHAPGLLQGLKDGVRAHREARALRHWRALGLPAPAPVQVRRHAGHWELVLEAVNDALPLPDFLLTPHHDRPLLGRVAKKVGRLLADLDRSGAHHGDPHPGNLLIDSLGEPWLIDPTPQPLLSRRAAPGKSRWVRFCGQMRESSTPLFRAQVAKAYLEAHGPNPPPTSEEGRQQLELQARDWRSKEARARTLRWLRTSGATQMEGHSIHNLSKIQGQARSQAFPSSKVAQQTWLTYALIHEHGIPALHPSILHLAPSPIVESIVPNGLRTCDPSLDMTGLGRLLGRLHDRGLKVLNLGSADLYTDITGEVLLDPATIELDLRRPAPLIEIDLPRWVPPLTPPFIDAFLAQVGASRQQLLKLRSVFHGT